MVYLVSEQEELFKEDDLPYQRLDKHEALTIILGWDIVQYDSETNGGFN